MMRFIADLGRVLLALAVVYAAASLTVAALRFDCGTPPAVTRPLMRA